MMLQRVVNYANQLIDGEIIACKKHRWAAMKFIRDLENPNYYFDVDELERFYDWSRLFRHTKGVLAGKPIELVDFQLFVIAGIFCFKYKENGRRVVRKVYIQLARKNAKSQLLALIASYKAFLSGEQEEIYIAGWGREQSSLVYNEILQQIRAVPELAGKFTDSYGHIRHIRSGSIIRPLSREARKTGDGTNPSLGILDEYHAHETSEIYDVLESGMIARPEPLIVIITTAGFDLSKPCYREYEYVSKLLDPNNPIENEEYFSVICELEPEDDIKDETKWIKANPIVATYDEGIRSIRSTLTTALESLDKMRSFLTKNMNKWVNMRSAGYMDMQRWKNAEKTMFLSDFYGKECILGLDLSAKIDLTSLSLIFKEDQKYSVFSHSFMPEETIWQKVKTDKVPYDSWVEQGYITATPGAVVDYSYIAAYIRNLWTDHQIIVREIVYDPWNAAQFGSEMEAEGFTMVEMRQGIASLGEPTKNFRESVYSGDLYHDGNPVLTWAMGNAVTRSDANENIMLDKSKSFQRIDPAAAMMNAHARAMHWTNETGDISVFFIN